MIASIVSLGTDFVQTGFNESTMQREEDNYQWIAFERERMWWTGPSGDPTEAKTVSQAGPLLQISIPAMVLNMR